MPAGSASVGKRPVATPEVHQRVAEFVDHDLVDAGRHQHSVARPHVAPPSLDRQAAAIILSPDTEVPTATTDSPSTTTSLTQPLPRPVEAASTTLQSSPSGELQIRAAGVPPVATQPKAMNPSSVPVTARIQPCAASAPSSAHGHVSPPSGGSCVEVVVHEPCSASSNSGGVDVVVAPVVVGAAVDSLGAGKSLPPPLPHPPVTKAMAIEKETSRVTAPPLKSVVRRSDARPPNSVLAWQHPPPVALIPVPSGPAAAQNRDCDAHIPSRCRPLRISSRPHANRRTGRRRTD